MSVKITVSLVKKLRERTGLGIMECKTALMKANGDIELAIKNMRKFGIVKSVKKSGYITTEGAILAKSSSDHKFGALLELNCETDFLAKNVNFLEFGNTILQSVINDKLTDVQLKLNQLQIKFEEQRTAMVAKVGENIKIRRIKTITGDRVGYYLHGIRIGVIVAAEGAGADAELIKYIAMHIAASKPEYVLPTDVPKNVIFNEQQIQFDNAVQSGKPHDIAEKIVNGRIKKFIEEISLTSQPFIMDQTKTIGVLLKENNAKVTNFIRFEIGEEI